MSRARTLVAAAALALVAAGCSGSSSDGDEATTTAADAPTTEASVAETEPTGDAIVIEEPTLSAPLDQEYPTGGLFEAGSVTANWYQAGGQYVVVYSGLDLEAVGPACPGNSIQTASGFEDVSNSPTAEGGCEGATTPEPETAPLICGDLVIYTTLIPAGTEGTLYGTFERSSDSGFVGATSTAPTDGSDLTEIDTSGSEYEFEGTTYTC